MEAPVSVNEVINPRRRLIEKLISETREAPTITAKPIIRQFNGLISRRNPLSFPISLNLVSLKIHLDETRNPYNSVSYSYNTFRFISEIE